RTPRRPAPRQRRIRCARYAPETIFWSIYVADSVTCGIRPGSVDPNIGVSARGGVLQSFKAVGRARRAFLGNTLPCTPAAKKSGPRFRGPLVPFDPKVRRYAGTACLRQPP